MRDRAPPMGPDSAELPGWVEAAHERALRCLALAESAVGGRYGLIRGVWDLATEPDDPRLFHAVAQTASCEPLFGRHCHGINGGSGFTAALARASAVGEALERYAAAAYDDAELVHASYSELAGARIRALDPASVPLYSERQYQSPGFPFPPFRTDTRLRWVWGTSLVSCERLLVPACLVFIPFEEDARVVNAISTGLACDLSPTGAALSALYEVIERDAIMIMWLGELPAPRIDLEATTSLGGLLDRVFRPSGVQFRVNDISNDLGIPVAFALAVDEANDGLTLNAGAAANADPERAIAKALMEAAQGRLWLRQERAEGHLDAILDRDRVATFDDHVRWFGHRRHLHHIDFLSAGAWARMDDVAGSAGGDRTPADRLDEMVKLLAQKDLEVIIVDVTPTDVSDLGFTVVKALVPGLVDLNAHHLLALKGNQRLYEVPERLGYGPRDEDTLSDVPHPFP
jgi:ribosomal protein S12 methylthiotransferase accessory factor